MVNSVMAYGLGPATCDWVVKHCLVRANRVKKMWKGQSNEEIKKDGGGVVRLMCVRACRTPQEAERHAVRRCEKRCKGCEVVIMSELDDVQCILQCKGCGEVKSPESPCKYASSAGLHAAPGG